VSGLTATVQIPAAGGLNGGPGTFVVVSPIDLQVSTTAKVTLTFSKPVRGVSASIGNGGRFERSPSMSAYSNPANIGTNIPPSASVTATAFDSPSPGDDASTPLQIRSEMADIKAVVLQFPPNDEAFAYDIINLRVESGSGPDASAAVPASGLKQWLRADSIYQSGYVFAPLPVWPDKSGNHADASMPGGVQASLPDGPNCAPVVALSGFGLSANLPINGWTGMTVFLVSKSATDVGGWWENQPLFWGETQEWGTTFFTPSQSGVFFRFGTTQVNNQPIYSRPVTAGGDYTLLTAIHNGTTDSLYLNGVLALTQGGKESAIAGTSSTEWIGKGLNNTFFSGAVGEILVYDRALTDVERDNVEHYLMKKFGLF
jgi:concanavalin A-like lectin/glucanase superfamily protein